MLIGENLNTILKKKNISQYRLAKKSGVSQAYICELIKGKYNNPSIDKLTALSKALNVSVTKLTKEAA